MTRAQPATSRKPKCVVRRRSRLLSEPPGDLADHGSPGPRVDGTDAIARGLVVGPAGEAMTCGYAVNETVGNPAHAWITTVILWITKIISVAFLGRLRRA